MVSDFTDEIDGYLHHDGKEAHVLLETQNDGYFNGKFLEQVKVAIDIFEAKYPTAQAVFMFDNAPCTGIQTYVSLVLFNHVQKQVC